MVEKKKPKTAVMQFLQGMEQMSEVATKPKPAANVLKQQNKFAEQESAVRKEGPIGTERLKPFDKSQKFTLPSGNQCEFVMKYVDSAKCRVWAGNARNQKKIDIEELDALKASISAQGQLIPALARRIPEDSKTGVTHEIIYGSRRLKACQELKKDIKVLEAVISDEDAVFFMDAENASRQDLSLYEKAESYNAWIKEGIFNDKAHLARSLGISERWVRQLISFLSIPKELVESLPSLKDLTKPRAEKVIFYISKYSDAKAVISSEVATLKKEQAGFSAEDIFSKIEHAFSKKQTKGESIELATKKDITAQDGEKILTLKTSKTGKVSIDVNRGIAPQRLSRLLDGLDKLVKKI